MDVPSPFADPDQPQPAQPAAGSLRMSIFEQSRIVHPSTSTYAAHNNDNSRIHIGNGTRHHSIREENEHDLASSAAITPAQSYTGNAAQQSRTNIDDQADDDDDDDDDQDPEDLLSDQEIGLLANDNTSRKSTSRLPLMASLTGSSSGRRSRSGPKHRSSRHGNSSSSSVHRSRAAALGGLSPKQKALWMWANVDNMDAFLQEVYAYYVGKGAICIALSRTLNLLTIAFVIGFSTFLFGCIDYSAIRHDGALGDVIVGHCVSGFSPFSTFVVVVLAAIFGWQVVQFALGLSRLSAMHRFYTHLLNIPDADVQSIPWHEVVNRIAALREQHPNTSLSSADEIESGLRTGAGAGGAGGGVGGRAQQQRLDAHDVANRIMRQENYLIALFNENILDLSVPGLRHRSPALTKTLEWNLNFCLLGFLFDGQGQVRRQFLSERYRADLVEGLRRRFLFMAMVNAVFAPFIVLYLVIYSFFRYFEEYHKDPSNLGSRQYTQYARWKFREFNELPHLFRRRCHSSYAPAQKYIDQFPKEKTAIVARFVAFVAGSFTAVLLLASVIDPDLFLHFDITPQRNVLFYIGVFGAILAVARGMIPDDHLVFEPETVLREVIQHTHYLPEDWKGRFHSAEVHTEFGQLYTLKIYIFVQELLSVITTPFVLWLSLPSCAPDLIDFFRKYTVHIDGLGHVCSFAVFDFARQPTASTMGGAAAGGVGRARRSRSNNARDGKMEQSILGFKANHPDWDPTHAGTSVMIDEHLLAASHNHSHGPGHGHGNGSSHNSHAAAGAAAPTRTRNSGAAPASVGGIHSPNEAAPAGGGAKVMDLLDHISRGRGSVGATRW
ncbi:APG9-domain-containing protein [Testicularia cyperi]|uniref:Autophagy-related protein 9 n=1 Tax=Testicularia cyperi TaxID=1882483 RepID=A0A317XQ76_9BASI|nr:APG9-domain-containing protein [Testicularia cyperi]